MATDNVSIRFSTLRLNYSIRVLFCDQPDRASFIFYRQKINANNSWNFPLIDYFADVPAAQQYRRLDQLQTGLLYVRRVREDLDFARGQRRRRDK